MRDVRRILPAAILACALAAGLIPAAAQSQHKDVIDDSVRRVIFVPGITFDKPVGSAEDQKPINACYRAVEKTFHYLFNILTVPGLRKTGWLHPFTTLPLYTAQQIYAFDYNPAFEPIANSDDPAHVNEPCVRYSSVREPLETIDHDPSYKGPPNDNTYQGVDTRGFVRDFPDLDSTPESGGIFQPPPVNAPTNDQLKPGAAARFGHQFRAWIDECPQCHFDIITHSLGGAVVAYWLAAYAEARDTKSIHSVITIDSPVNGVDAWGEASGLTELGISNITIGPIRDLVFSNAGGLITGKVAQDLQDSNFGRMSRQAAGKVDMRCISNLNDMLIPSQWATIQPEGAAIITYKTLTDRVPTTVKGPCENLVDHYTVDDPFDITFINQLVKALAISPNAAIPDLNVFANAHTKPLDSVSAWVPVVEQIARDTPKWSAANTPFAADLQLAGRSPFLTPGAETSIEVQLLNRGNSPWETNKVSLRLVEGVTFGLAKEQPLSQQVNPGEEIPLRLKFAVPKTPGVYPSRWQLTHGTTYFGPQIKLDLIVLPAGREQSGVVTDPVAIMRGLIDKLAADVQARIEDEIRRLEEAAAREALRQICGAVPAMVLATGGLVAWRRRNRLDGGEEGGDEF